MVLVNCQDPAREPNHTMTYRYNLNGILMEADSSFFNYQNSGATVQNKLFKQCQPCIFSPQSVLQFKKLKCT
jgi:hypothetical protein